MASIPNHKKAPKVVNNEEEEPIHFVDGQLSYVGRDAVCIPGELVQTHGALVRRLDLSYNALKTLDGLEGFPNLEELILDGNLISDDAVFPRLPQLHTLVLNKNKVKDLDHLLDQLSTCSPQLTYLSMLANEACPNQLSGLDKDEEDYQRYRYYVLHRLPNLKFLDSTPIKMSERNEAKRQGAFLRVVRPPENVLNEQGGGKEKESSLPYTPLPSSLREDDDHQASFGRYRYVYHGRQSEGNRFISNDDL